MRSDGEGQSEDEAEHDEAHEEHAALDDAELDLLAGTGDLNSVFRHGWNSSSAIRASASAAAESVMAESVMVLSATIMVVSADMSIVVSAS